jgi:hypothetical protein
VQVIAEVSLEQDADGDYDRKLHQLRREEELIHEEAKGAAAFLQADLPVIQPGQARMHACLPAILLLIPWALACCSKMKAAEG